MQSALAEIVIVGQTMEGKVMVTIDGNQKLQGIKIDDDVPREKIADAIKEAFDGAQKKMQKEMAAKMKDMGGLDMLKNMGM